MFGLFFNLAVLKHFPHEDNTLMGCQHAVPLGRTGNMNIVSILISRIPPASHSHFLIWEYVLH